LAHGQTFCATGTIVEKLRLRVAQLTDQQPAAPLEVEIRSPDLRTFLVHGLIQPREASRYFQGVSVRFNFSQHQRQRDPRVWLE
jgi:hypothetical protein